MHIIISIELRCIWCVFLLVSPSLLAQQPNGNLRVDGLYHAAYVVDSTSSIGASKHNDHYFLRFYASGEVVMTVIRSRSPQGIPDVKKVGQWLDRTWGAEHQNIFTYGVTAGLVRFTEYGEGVTMNYSGQVAPGGLVLRQETIVHGVPRTQALPVQVLRFQFSPVDFGALKAKGDP